MTLYDINGNKIIIESGSNSGSSGGTITLPATDIGLANLGGDLVDKVIDLEGEVEVVNLLDVSKVSVGQLQSNGNVGEMYPKFRTSDYIEVKAGQTYIAQTWDSMGNTSYDKVVLFDESKAPLKTITTSGGGGFRYAKFTPEVKGYARYCYNYKEDGSANPMMFIGKEKTYTFVPYNPNKLEPDAVYKYNISSKFRDMILRDVIPSNIYGKTVYMIGDSNSDNWTSAMGPKLAKRYNCTVKGYGKYGATWGDSNGIASTATGTAIGQYNAMIKDLGIDPTSYTLPENSVFLFMMGTNTATGGVGEVPESISSMTDDVSTDLGAANYILKRLKYYSRNATIGVFLPWCCNAVKKQGLIRLCEYYKIPYFDVEAIICGYEPTYKLERPDGTLVENNYITDGGNHLSQWGWDEFERIAHHWIAYEI